VAVQAIPSTCTACVACPVVVTCRTTGGGQLNPDVVQAGETNGTLHCTNIPTILFPSVNAAGLTIREITHGGQLGAPYAQKDCGEILGNPCIRGQWQHTRHWEGKGNPRDVVTSIHTATPKGQFDTLNCACLPCCTNAAGDVKQPNGNFFGTTNHFTLCNKDDHRICGPAPRPSPANALIWTGLASYTPFTDAGPSAKQAEWIVVRVYIEDRSEPGGAHPGGASAPADIYAFQAWRTGALVSKGKPLTEGEYDAIAAPFRRALGTNSCNFLQALVDQTIPQGSMPPSTVNGLRADIIDMGPLQNGNRQIHPSTSAMCTP
jgi:hypothetical protein